MNNKQPWQQGQEKLEQASKALFAYAHREELGYIARHRGWFIGLGLCLLTLGGLALYHSYTATLISVSFFGWLMLFGGVARVLQAFYARRWSGFFQALLSGLLAGLLGFFFLSRPLVTAASFTLVLALFFLAEGALRAIQALFVRPAHWFWLLLSGLVAIALGVMIWRQWPASGLWVIGTFIGIDLLFNGWAYLMLGLAARRLPTRE